jgi:hypothetical protein
MSNKGDSLLVEISLYNLTRIALHVGKLFLIGEVPERSNGAVSKTVEPSRAPWVRIPASPHTSYVSAFGLPHQASIPE